MINRTALVNTLKEHYPALEVVSDAVLRAIDVYDGRPYAIRYFDLTDDIVSVATRLSAYQEHILGTSYFDRTSKSDLRWNHYLYFLISLDPSLDAARAKAKSAIESDREYARKLVLTESELGDVLAGRTRQKATTVLPPDPVAEWARTLEAHDLGFVVDEAIQVPAVVRHIAKGERQGLRRPPAAPELSEAERRVATEILKSLSVRQFRRYPIGKEYDFGIVNLIMGVNGVGKTSLLEAIEYLFCGKVRRSDDAPAQASVAGVLAGSGLQLETTSNTTPARLRARHLVWYGKADVRVPKLDDSFGKFNFLDTDAAARLTVEQSQERINADLAQLLLGAEAAKTLVRFERLAKGLVDIRRDLERDIEVRDQRRLDAMTRLQQLRSTPQESDALFRKLIEMLKEVGWKTNAPAKTDAESLADAIQSALVNVGVLKAAGSTVPRDRGQLAAMKSQLARATTTVTQALQRRRQLERLEAQAQQALRTVDARANAILQIFPMLDAGLDEIARDLESKKQHVATRATAQGTAEPAARAVAEEKALSSVSIRQAVDDYAKQVDQRSIALKDARRSVDVFERGQAALTNFAQQLRSVARQIIEHTHDDTHCPLCGTQLSRVDLEARLREQTQSLAEGESQRMRSQLQEAEVAHQRAVAVLQALRTLDTYQASPGSRTTVRTLLTRIAAEREELVKLQTELDALRQRVQEHEKKGWTLDRLRDVARAAAVDPSDLNRESVEALSASLTEQRVQHLDALAKVQEERQTLADQVSSIARETAMSAVEPAELLTGISERAKIVEDVSRASGALAQQLDTAPVTSELELEARLREAHEVGVRLQTAVAKEYVVGDAIKKDSQVVDEATAEVAALRVQAGRVDSARNVISDLIEKQSGQALTNQVLRENGAQIAATFGRIHAPNEFDVEVADEGLKITRRATKAKVDLHEMSSGQRAAFTLSLFLAMNGRLTTGPTAIIFDDPVAHVDDINTLSFIDHLREIALEGERQIFFATADSKLAGLFARKFRFMGEQFKQIELSRE